MNTHFATAASTIGNTVRIRPEVSAQIAKVEPLETPLLTLLEKVGKFTKVGNKRFTIQEEWPLCNRTTVTAGINSSATSVTPADSTIATANMLAQNTRTGEQLLITAASSSWTIVRGYGTTPAAAMVAGDTLLLIGTVLPEGYSRPATLSRAPNMHSNQTTKSHHAIQLTKDMLSYDFYGVPEVTRLEAQEVLEFKKRQERHLLFDEPVWDDAGSNSTYPRSVNGGARWYCKLYNRFNMGGVVTLRGIRHVLTACSRYGGAGEKIILTGSTVFSLLSDLPQLLGAGQNEPMMISTLGDNVKRFSFPGGSATIALDYNFEGAGLDSEALILDARYLEGREFRALEVERDVQDPGSGFKQDQMIVDRGLACTMPLAWGYVYNMKRAGA
jgi:hypothetical protein